MKAIKLLLGFTLLLTLATSCYTEVIVEDDFIDAPGLNVGQVLQAYDLWYVDINETIGNGEVPFLQRAFTISFDHTGTVHANNNIVGIGKTGNGLGIDVGAYGFGRNTVEIDHDIDGIWVLELIVRSNNKIELYDSASNTSYLLRGYQANNFDYDMVFYNNLQYFLQEYDAWEKSYTSQEGAINDFDEETFLQFFSNGNENIFKSSVDSKGTSVHKLVWDYEGLYQVYDVEGDETLKTLTLDYDFLGDDYFELYVINDSTIELYHPSSKTVYEFKGKGYKLFLKSGKNSVSKKRKKTINPVMKVKRSRK
ncbi:MAG: nicotinic acid mononucleotide adenyltransferase [Cellulophaga sp.]